MPALGFARMVTSMVDGLASGERLYFAHVEVFYRAFRRWTGQTSR